MTSPALSFRLLALGAAIALSTAACSASSEPRADVKSGVATTLVADTARVSADSGGGSRPTTTAGVRADDRPQVIGSSTGQHPAGPSSSTMVPLRLDIYSVKRLSGDAIEVRLGITNTGNDDKFSSYVQMSDRTMTNLTYDIGGLALLDLPNDKKYLTLFGTDKICLCTGGLGALSIEPGKTAQMYADVSAPPESVTTIDLTLPGFAPVIGLKIQ